MARPSLDDPKHYINRHLSWLEFNRRVLAEAQDEANPVLERVKFLAITASNLDEFVEIRVAGILQLIEHGYREPGPDGRTPEEEMREIAKEMQSFVPAQYSCWNSTLIPKLAESGIRVLSLDKLNVKARAAANDFYKRRVYPLLTPVTVDPAHPFPRVLNKALCVAFLLRRRRNAAKPLLGVVTVPRALPRLFRLPSSQNTIDYVFLQDIVTAHAAALYRGYEILSAAPFRVTRNSNLYLQEEESRNLLDAVDSQLHSRRRGDAVRLEIEDDANPEIISRLRDNFGVEPSLVFQIRGPISLSRLFHLYEETPRLDLKFRPFTSRKLALGEGPAPLFEILRRQNILLHHPYESYSTVVNFIESAAKDPDVLSIKQTLYRTSEDSPIVRALMDAAAANKEVTVVVELKARFDEASNIRFARHMEEAGVQVVHGVVGLKTHCKLALLARQEPDGKIRRFAHVGTGNYNPVTARFYTDLSFFTSDENVTASVHDVFNFLTAYAEHGSYDPLFVAPKDMSRNCLQLIEREIGHARRGRPARIIAKVNALLDKPIIHALYRASRAGVDIDLIVRGACALRPGVRGLSDRIRVRSIVGRFLEHSRIFFFENGSQPEIYLGSADWMPRNLHERVEVMLHVNDNDLCRRIYGEILMLYLADNEKARVLRADASWVHVRHSNLANGSRNGHSFNAQEYMIRVAEGTGAESVGSLSLPASVKGALGRRFSSPSS